MAVYGLAADQSLNKGTKLYIPGQTKLGAGDVFLGGTGTGITDEMLGGATRVYGNTAQDTASAYGDYKVSQAENKALADKESYRANLTNLANQVAQQAAAAKKLALDQAWGSNQQALNSQKSTVDNNYQSATNKLTALQSSRLPEYQAQKDATSQEAAAQLRRTQALNAMTGKFNSGYNRSQMNDVGIARQGSLDAVQGSENAFKTDVGNQMSDVERSRVAALNDIAEKLTLGQKQYNEGSLSLTNQLQSEIANGALKASMDAQTWADTQKQLGIDNSLRQAQLDQAAKLAQLQQDFQEKQFLADQEAQSFNQALQAGQITGTYNGQSTLAKQAQEAEQAYRQAALAVSSAKAYAPKALSAPVKYSNSSTASMKDKMDSALANGAPPAELLYELQGMVDDGTTDLKNVDVEYLRSYLEGKVPTISDLRRSQGGGI